jgi:hypothetical protein
MITKSRACAKPIKAEAFLSLGGRFPIWAISDVTCGWVPNITLGKADFQAKIGQSKGIPLCASQ